MRHNLAISSNFSCVALPKDRAILNPDVIFHNGLLSTRPTGYSGSARRDTYRATVYRLQPPERVAGSLDKEIARNGEHRRNQQLIEQVEKVLANEAD